MKNLSYLKRFTSKVLPILSLSLLVNACTSNNQNTNSNNFSNSNNTPKGFEVKFLLGSDLKEFCNQASQKFNKTNPKLDNGTSFHLTCEAKGSGDVINTVLNLAQQYKQGAVSENSPQFPTLVSVDGEIYQSQFIFQMNKLFPGKNYIPEITDSPLLTYSPMVFMTTTDLAPGLEKVDNLYVSLTKANNHKDLDENAPPLPINYVHTAPTRSNSGLQTLVAQFASVAGKPPEDLTIADIEKYQGEVSKIQSKITRYGKSTGTLAKSMVENGPFWASVGSVYESLVIQANSNFSTDKKYKAIYPKATFSSNKRAILPKAPWVSEEEREAAEEIIEYLRTPEIQQLASELGLRPGIPEVSLGGKFSAQFGVNPNPTYESYRPPQPEVVEAMLKSWQQFAKKPSQVAVVIDTSGSMSGRKLTAVKNTLLNYINNLGNKEKIALISFNSKINEPVIIDGTDAGKEKGIRFISSLKAQGGTALYDTALYARNWLIQNQQNDAINAVLVLTDGEDSGSKINLNQLSQELQKSGFSSDQRISFFTVGYGKDGDFNADALKQIAKINGGYYRKGNPETISNLMADLQVEF